MGAAAGRPLSRRARRLVGLAVGLASLAAAALVLRERWGEVGGIRGLPGPLPLAVAVAANAVANAVLVQSWRRVLAAAGTDLGWRPAAWVWAASQLTRYTVGAAQVGGRAVVGRAYGVTPALGAVSALVEVAWQTSLTATLALATLPWWLGEARSLAWLAVVAALPAGVLVAGMIAPGAVLSAAQRAVRRLPFAGVRDRLAGGAERVRLDRRDAGAITGLLALNSALRLIAFLVLVAAVAGQVGGVLRAVGAYALGQVVGRAAVFVPGGLGPREGASALVLGPATGAGAALLAVGLVRLVEIVAELGFLAAARSTRPRPHEVTASRRPPS